MNKIKNKDGKININLARLIMMELSDPQPTWKWNSKDKEAFTKIIKKVSEIERRPIIWPIESKKFRSEEMDRAILAAAAAFGPKHIKERLQRVFKEAKTKTFK